MPLPVPVELERAAEELRQGTDLEKMGDLMRDGLLESEGNLFPKLRDVLGGDAPEQGPQMNMNL